MLLNAAQAIVEHKSGQTHMLNILTYVTAAPATIIESVVWVAVVEMPAHEYRVYTIACAWIGQWLVTMLVLLLLYYFSSRSYVMFVSSFALIAITALVFMRMPNTRNKTTSQIFRQFLTKN